MKTRKVKKPWMRTRPDKAPRPAYDSLVLRLGDLIALCHKWRVYGAALTHAEHDYNRALLVRPNRVSVHQPELKLRP